MKLYLVKKEKGKNYDSGAICERCFGFQLLHEENGKPAAEISISHTTNYWVCILDMGGVDIEETGRRVNPKIAKRLHPLEQKYLAGLAEGSKEWSEEFLSIWTAKESYMKALGKGLAAGLGSFSVIAEDLSYAEKLGGFYLKHFRCGGFMGCLASFGPEEIEIEELAYAGVNKKDAFDFAADKLAEKAWSKKGLSEKMLAKGYSKEETESVTGHLVELGYLSDSAFAESLVASAKLAGKGSSYIKMQLAKEGISEERYQESAEEEFERAFAIAKKIYKPCEDRLEKEKALARLGRKLASAGFSPSAVYKVLAKLR